MKFLSIIFVQNLPKTYLKLSINPLKMCRDFLFGIFVSTAQNFPYYQKISYPSYRFIGGSDVFSPPQKKSNLPFCNVGKFWGN